MIYNTVHTIDFIRKWKNILIDLYGYDEYMDFFVVKSLSGIKTLSYIPFLNYTDRLNNNILDLLELSKDNKYQIRVLNNNYKDFKDYDTVTMRLDISSGDYDKIFKNLIVSKCRNQIRKAEKSSLIFKIGNGELLSDFYKLFFDTMHKYGTPVFPKRLFELILNNIESKICVVYFDDKPISALILLKDNDISIVPWAASDSNYNKYCPNHLIYAEAIKYSIENKSKIFDFGRSGYNTSKTYNFKKQWGAVPVKIDIISSEVINVYSKYTLASKIWEKLPKSIIEFMGPKLCKYLVDL